MSSNREFDIVIFGATGFTGLMMVRELALSIQEKSELSNLKWAIAGRNEAKLSSVLEKVGQELNQNLTDIPKIIADINNPDSLLQMAKRANVIVNSVGPYFLYGKQVVEACVSAGTHHLDLSGEPVFIESCALEFNARAQESGSLIISTCGFDSIPIDVGVAYLKKHFPGQLHSVETFMSIIPGEEGYVVNIGTFESAINIVPFFFTQLRIHSRLYRDQLTKKLPKSRISLSPRILPFTRPDVPGVCVFNPAVDKHVAERTQYYEFDNFGERPVQVQTYITAKSWGNLIKLGLIGSLVLPFTFFSAGRKLLTNYPHVFTFGLFSKEGPSRVQIDTTRIVCRLVGKGWTSQKTDGGEPTRPFDQEMILIVRARDPGYLATSTAIMQSAITICLEREKMPKGGVLTPAAAFRDTKLVDRLQAHDFTFELVDKKK